MTAYEKSCRKEICLILEGQGLREGRSQPFWLSLLRDVYGITEPEKIII